MATPNEQKLTTTPDAAPAGTAERVDSITADLVGMNWHIDPKNGLPYVYLTEAAVALLRNRIAAAIASAERAAAERGRAEERERCARLVEGSQDFDASDSAAQVAIKIGVTMVLAATIRATAAAESPPV